MKTTFSVFPVTLLLCGLLALGPRPLWALPYQEPPASDASGAREEAARKLQQAGLTGKEASARTDGMTDEEARHAAGKETEIRRGGDVTTVILLLAVIGLVAYIVYEKSTQTQY